MTKYRAKPTFVDGIRFASKKEAARYGELKLLERVGKVTCLELQPKFEIKINGIKICTYIADFKYCFPGKEVIIEDVKGVKTPIYRLKKKLVKACHGIEIFET